MSVASSLVGISEVAYVVASSPSTSEGLDAIPGIAVDGHLSGYAGASAGASAGARSAVEAARKVKIEQARRMFAMRREKEARKNDQTIGTKKKKIQHGKKCPGLIMCAARSGPKARECKCGAEFPYTMLNGKRVFVTNSKKCLQKRKDRAKKQKAKKLRRKTYNESSMREKIAYFEKNFLDNCVFCRQPSGYTDPNGITRICNDCNLVVCTTCARNFAQRELDDAFGFYRFCPRNYERNAKGEPADRFGRWKCPGPCQSRKFFPVYVGNNIVPSLGCGATSLDAFLYKETQDAVDEKSVWDQKFNDSLCKRKRACVYMDKVATIWQTCPNAKLLFFWSGYKKESLNSYEQIVIASGRNWEFAQYVKQWEKENCPGGDVLECLRYLYSSRNKTVV